MAGIYLHIPFCSQKCNYCDFYSIVPLKRKADFLDSLIKEMDYRKNYFDGELIETIYFGGGTPSLLSIEELDLIVSALYQRFTISKDVEFTLEANPDNLSTDYIRGLKASGVNRLSIGVQSFTNNNLQFLKRSHTSEVAYSAVEKSYALGIDNISIDLIYGLPGLSMIDWEGNLKRAFTLPIKHLSSYHLTYEKNTLLYKRLKQGKIQAIEEGKSIEQFRLLMDYTQAQNMPYYEISNFAKADFYSKHNLSYWQQKNI